MSNNIEFQDNWYILKVVSGRETTVESKLTVLKNDGVISDVYLPTKPVVYIKKGKKTSHNKSVFSGYIMVNMFIDKNSMNAVRSVSGVLGFISNNDIPTPLKQGEVDRVMQNLKSIADEIDDSQMYYVGQKVKIVDGPFESFVGELESIDTDRRKLRVAVTIFGRSTPVELEWNQVNECND